MTFACTSRFAVLSALFLALVALPAIANGRPTAGSSGANRRVVPTSIQPKRSSVETITHPSSSDTPDLKQMLESHSEIESIIERYQADFGSLSRKYPLEMSEIRSARMRSFLAGWLDSLQHLGFDALSSAGKIDFLLFRNYLNHALQQIDLKAKARAEIAPLIPFAPAILSLEEARQAMEKIDPEQSAVKLNDLAKQIAAAQHAVEADLAGSSGQTPRKWKTTAANRAAETVRRLQDALKHWYGYYHGYDPLFSWWAEEPYKSVDGALTRYGEFLKEKVVGIKPGDTTVIIGDPIGREALLTELAYEMIPYTPEELIDIANRELAWCDAEMKKASHELGYGDDWHKALEHVKNLHVEPGKQTEMIRELALEAIDVVETRNLVTVPTLAKESWRMEMMSPERQLVNPFFLGGEMIQVSYPTNTMTHEQKMMSMRGNNRHFARATVHHELIPGHHLQMFMMERYRPYRQVFDTPFWIEGWALYWEMLLWDKGFAQSPENRVGMLFWRMHRCARIIFSLSFQLEKMTPQECIEMLVDRVGHERANAEAEVRRSFKGDYGPLYQAAYLLGGLQIRSLHHELVDSGKMTDRAFHDAILHENCIPIEMVRAILTKQMVTPDFKSNWRFYPK